jgi:DUF971 family protein
MGMQVTELKRRSNDAVALKWSDGHNGFITLRALRDRCPCAGCQGESVLFARYEPPAFDSATPGRYELNGASPVGNYGLKLLWGDGHDQGIYTWEYLRALCECDACLVSREDRGPGKGQAGG